MSQLDSQGWALLIVILCGGLLGTALIMEHGYDLVPCPLCLMQQLWFLFAGLLAYIAIAHNPRLGIYPVLIASAAIIGAGFAIRQLWLQSLPEGEAPACGPDIDYMIRAFPLSETLSAMMSGTGDCAKVSWRFLGLTIPGWALLNYLLIVVLAVMQWRTKRNPTR